jgi:hypothetical protein
MLYDDQIRVQATTVFFEVTAHISVMRGINWKQDAIKFVVSYKLMWFKIGVVMLKVCDILGTAAPTASVCLFWTLTFLCNKNKVLHEHYHLWSPVSALTCSCPIVMSLYFSLLVDPDVMDSKCLWMFSLEGWLKMWLWPVLHCSSGRTKERY